MYFFEFVCSLFLVVFRDVFRIFRYGLLAVPEIISKSIVKQPFSVKSVLHKMCYELNPSDSIIPAVTHERMNGKIVDCSCLGCAIHKV